MAAIVIEKAVISSEPPTEPHRSMTHDPFERLERSRGGLWIPALLFVLGAVPTALAIRALDEIEGREDTQEEIMDEGAPEEVQPAVEPVEFVEAAVQDEESAGA